jgi:hypothetical protein
VVLTQPPTPSGRARRRVKFTEPAVPVVFGGGPRPALAQSSDTPVADFGGTPPPFGGNGKTSPVLAGGRHRKIPESGHR